MTRGYTPTLHGSGDSRYRDGGVPQGLILKPLRFTPQNTLMFNMKTVLSLSDTDHVKFITKTSAT